MDDSGGKTDDEPQAIQTDGCSVDLWNTSHAHQTHHKTAQRNCVRGEEGGGEEGGGEEGGERRGRGRKVSGRRKAGRVKKEVGREGRRKGRGSLDRTVDYIIIVIRNV